MNYTYRFAMDEEYCRTMIRRYYQQQPRLLRPEYQFAAGFVLMFLLTLFVLRDFRVATISLFLLFDALIAVGGLAAVRVVTYQNFSYSPLFGDTSVCNISEEGLQMSGAWLDELVAWPKLSWAARHPDGILILRRAWILRDWVQLQPRRLCWLPDSALHACRPQEVTQFISGMTALRYVA